MNSNKQDGNVGNLGDILKHAALVQLAKIFANQVKGTKYYLDSHSYLYQSFLANPRWQIESQTLLVQSGLYKDYIDLEAPYIIHDEYLCSSGLVNKLLPDAHLLLCESNESTRDHLLQQLIDNRVDHHSIKQQLVNFSLCKSLKKLDNMLILIDPYELTDILWHEVSQCLPIILDKNASSIMLVFDYKQEPEREWQNAPNWCLARAASISIQPYHLVVYATEHFVMPVKSRLKQLGWNTT